MRVCACVCQCPYPPGHRGVGPLFELRVCGKAVPHDERRVVLVPQLRTALKQEVYDEELDAGIQAWRGERALKREHSNIFTKGRRLKWCPNSVKRLPKTMVLGK